MLQDYFWQLSCIVMFFVLSFGCYGGFAKTIVAWSKPPVMSKSGKTVVAAKIETKDTVLCYIPLVQVYMVKKALYGSAKVEAVLSIISSVFITLNLINKFFLPINGVVMFVCNIMMLVGTAMALLIYGIVTARCAHAYDCGIFMTILSLIIPCLICMWLKTNITYRMKQLHKEEALSGNGSSTVIKSRAN